MLWFIILLCLVSPIVSTPVLNRRMIRKINSYPGITWIARIPEFYRDYTVDDFRILLNSTPTWNGEEVYTNDAINVPTEYVADHSYRYNPKHLDGCASIQRQILKTGPVSAKISVFSDLPAYNDGVYVHRVGTLLGAHNVRIVGWGYDNKTHYPYWLVDPSWNNEWGLNGYFKIIRGVNECGIEEDVQ